MKALYIFLIIVIPSVQSYGQEIEEIGKISLSVVLPENVEGLNRSQLSKLKSKILQITTINGLGGNGNNHNFVIYPKFAVYETRTVEGGMKNIIITDCELSLFIKQVDENIVFSSVSVDLQGSGFSKTLAVTNALFQLDVKSEDFQSFINTGNDKILTYYNSRCKVILAESDQLSKLKRYDEAIALMMNTPSEVECYTKILEKSVEVYQAFQSQICVKQVRDARFEVAKEEYNKVYEILREIDPTSKCFSEISVIMKEIEDKISKEKRLKLESQIRIEMNEMEMEKHRLDSAKEETVSFNTRNRQIHNYNMVVQ